jgi:putative SOS response-associated peptidase YedK
MCGRFALADDGTAVTQQFDLPAGVHLAPRYNIAPTQPIAAVRRGQHGRRELTHFYWGLVPSWSKDMSMASRLINARAETVLEKPSFKNAFKRRRCLVPMSGFYEWRKEGKQKQPVYIHPAEADLFAVAGLWEIWQSPEGETLQSCTLLTTSPNELMATIHDRMPVILAPADYDLWLDPASPLPAVEQLLQSYPAAQMTSYAVSSYVNSALNEGATCLLPLA